MTCFREDCGRCRNWLRQADVAEDDFSHCVEEHHYAVMRFQSRQIDICPYFDLDM